MNYLLLVCSDGTPTAEKTETMRREIPGWLANTRGRIFGQELAGPDTAKTVRVRDGEMLVTDGPFIETKEFVAGIDIVDCADLDEAIDVAARHPVSHFHMIEVRPFASDPSDARACVNDDGQPPDQLAARLAAPAADGATRFLLTMCLDGIPGTDEEEASVVHDSEAWGATMEARGIQVYGHPLGHADTATTVRVRDGETLLTDGPFIETKEFIGGIDIVDCAGVDEAIAVAAEHPLARFHMIEVRPFAQG